MNTLIPLVLAGSLLNPEYVTCNLWKYVKNENELVCLYSGKNGTLGYHYPTFSFRECPKQFECLYQPNAKEKVSLKDILKGLSDGF
jgi:hypothetical protein